MFVIPEEENPVEALADLLTSTLDIEFALSSEREEVLSSSDSSCSSSDVQFAHRYSLASTTGSAPSSSEKEMDSESPFMTRIRKLASKPSKSKYFGSRAPLDPATCSSTTVGVQQLNVEPSDSAFPFGMGSGSRFVEETVCALARP